MTPILFRPHHFLCSLGFQGKGYSDEFTANMAEIVGQLRGPGGDDTLITVVEHADKICGPCPLRRGRGCENQSKIARIDAAHLGALDLRVGMTLTWAEAQTRIAANVTPDDLDQLCAGCRWLPLGLCKDAVARLRAQKNAAPNGTAPD